MSDEQQQPEPQEPDLQKPSFATSLGDGFNMDIRDLIDRTTIAHPMFSGDAPDEVRLRAIDAKINVLQEWMVERQVRTPNFDMLYTMFLTVKMVEWGMISEEQLLEWRLDFAAFVLEQYREGTLDIMKQIQQAEAQQRMAQLMNGVPQSKVRGRRPNFPQQGPSLDPGYGG